MASIRVRSPKIEDRQVLDHGEGDLSKGKANASSVGTLLERTIGRTSTSMGAQWYAANRAQKYDLRPGPTSPRKSALLSTSVIHIAHSAGHDNTSAILSIGL